MRSKSVQLLIATVDNNPESLLMSMNLYCDSIVINQCNSLSSHLIDWNGCEVRWLNFAERGVGRSRNEALMRADAIYVLFCDDDCQYYRDIEQRIVEGFKRNPDADILLFDLKPIGYEKGRKPFRITTDGKVGRFSYMKYGAVHIAARLAALRKHNISFNLLFGGGSPYSCGEDSVFLKDCIDKGLVIKTCSRTIGCVDFSASSWFNGFDEKYFLSRGALHRRVAGRWHWILSTRLVLKLWKSLPESNKVNCLKLMLDGAAEFMEM